jgi:hypothetical protein
VPLEGHWDRQHTPIRRLSRRERRIVLPVTVALALACVAVIVFSLGGSSHSTAAGCVEVVGPSTMGASNYQTCGPQAARFCAAHANGDDGFARAAQQDCRRAGYR